MSTIAAKPPSSTMRDDFSFMGFVRQGGLVGVRNHLAVISTVALCNRIAELAAQRHEAGQN
jgi:altronate dehydratase